MSFTIVGPIILGAALWVFFARPDRLPTWIFFFAPFSGTAIINLSALSYKSGGLGLTPAMLLTVLFFASQIIRGKALSPIPISPGLMAIFGAIAGFIATIFISLFWNAGFRPMTSFQITQTVYVMIGFAATLGLALELTTDARIESAVAAARAAAIFSSIWGLVQFGCYTAGVPYPDWLFNNSQSDAADMFQQVVFGSFMRIASVAVEPSFFATSLLHYIAFGVTAIAHEPRLRTKYWIWPLALSCAVLVLSTSTTAYFGLAILGLMILISRPLFAIAIGVPSIILSGGLILTMPKFQAAFLALTVNKESSTSFLDRTAGAAAAWHNFVEHPALGMGWGWDAVNYNALTCMLGYTGVIGTLLFMIACVATLVELATARRNRQHGPDWKLAAYSAGAQNALIVAFACAVTSGIKYVVLDDWIFWALAIGIASRLSIGRSVGTFSLRMARRFARPSAGQLASQGR